MKTKTFDNYYFDDLLTDVKDYTELEGYDKILSIVISQYKKRYFATITLRP